MRDRRNRDRGWRRAQTQRYKEKSKRDADTRNASSAGIQSEPRYFSDTRHHFDCGKRCFMCSGDKLIFGRRRERYTAKREIRKVVSY